MPRQLTSKAVALVHNKTPVFPRQMALVPHVRGGRIRYQRNRMLFCEGDLANYAYVLLSGTVRCCKTLEDGRRQIIAFHFPGDLFGLSSGPEHTLSGEAVSDVQVMCLKRSSLLATASRDGKVASLLLAATTHELERLQEHSLAIARSAQSRLAHFLLALAARMNAQELELPMSRCEIADHLGLTIETVSRTFTELESTGVLEREAPRRIVILNLTALRNMTE